MAKLCYLSKIRESTNQDMRCPNCQTINPPQAKFCLECGNRLVVCPTCGTVNLPQAKFCIECGTALAARGERTQPLPPAAGNEAGTSVAAQSGQTQGAGPIRPVYPPPVPAVEPSASNDGRLALPEERRIVTIMFADIIGSTPLADRLDPEDLRAILVGYFNLMAEQIRRHEGTIEKYIGDAVMAIFGMPVAHEDDPDRAIRAALDMQQALADFNRLRLAQDPDATQLQMRIGINTGEVAAPGNAQASRRDFLITGDAVNVAARLQQVAAPDTILVGERTFLATRGVFDFRPITPLQLRGKPEPIAAWEVLDVRKPTGMMNYASTQHPRGIDGLHAPLIGRSLELTLIHATYARVIAERHPHLITLLGAPGVGKSRLIREFITGEKEAAKKAPGADTSGPYDNSGGYGGPPGPRVLEGRCPPYGESITYWPLFEILRSLVEIGSTSSPVDGGEGQAQDQGLPVPQTGFRKGPAHHPPDGVPHPTPPPLPLHFVPPVPTEPVQDKEESGSQDTPGSHDNASPHAKSGPHDTSGGYSAERFLEFVRTTLAKARRTEDPDEVASAISRSIGKGFSSAVDDQGILDKAELVSYPADRAQGGTTRRTDDLSKSASGLLPAQPWQGQAPISMPLRPPSHIGTESSIVDLAMNRRSPLAGPRPDPLGRTSSLTTDDPDRLERQRGKYGKETEQRSSRMALMRAWRVFLEALAEQQPLILIIDDLQWADEALLDLLEYLTDRVTNVPILFLCPARPDFFERRRDWGGGRRNFTTIALEALSTEESSRLISALLNTDEIPEVLRFTVLSRAEGNPFFVEEILRMLIDQKVLLYEDGIWRISTQNEALMGDLANPSGPPEDTLLDQHYMLPLVRIPDTIQGVLAARIDLLSAIEKLILQHASIIGRTFWLTALLELAGDLDPATLLQTLDGLVKLDFIVEVEKPGLSPFEQDRVFSFKHVLIRDVVYNNIPRIRRSYEHTRLALWLEKQAQESGKDFVELLAYHYQQALATWSPSLTASPVVINDAGHPHGRPQGSPPPGHTTPAPTSLRLTRPELRSRTITYLGKAGDQALECYYTIRAIQAYSEALDLLADSDADSLTLSRMHEKLGDAYYQRMDIDKALQEYRKALELQNAGEDRVEAPAESALKDGDETRLRLYERLAELSTRWTLWKDNIDIQEVRYYIDAGLELLAGRHMSGEYAAFLTYQALWYVRQMDMVDSAQRGELAELALQSEHEALHIAEELHDVGALWLTLDTLGFIYSHQHKYLEAHKAQHYRLTLADQITSREELHDLYQTLGWTHEYISDYPTAVMWFGRAWDIAQTMESPSLLLESIIGRMFVWYEWGHWPEAYEAAQNVLQVIEQYQQSERWKPYALLPLAVIAYQTGDQEQGDRYVRQYRRIIDRYGPNPELLSLEPFIHFAREDWTHAIVDYRETLQRREPFPPLDILTQLAELAVITGESVEEQQALCERAMTLTKESGNRKSFANALRARGRMYLEQEHWAEAEQDLQQARQICEELDVPWERGLTLYCLGLYYRRCADILNQENAAEREADLGRAHLYLEQALGYFEALKAVHDITRVLTALAQDNSAPV